MHYHFVVVGAHNGSKLEAAIRQVAEVGNVLLVEPLPHHCTALRNRFSGLKSVKIVEAAVSSISGTAEIHYIPNSEANGLPIWATELGSLNPNHVAAHLPQAADKLKSIRVATVSANDLIEKNDIDSIQQLNIDTEGHDYELIRSFPLWKIKPIHIVFEHKHMDGPNLIGPHFAETLLRLNGFGYSCRVLDAENTLAILRK